MRDYIYGSRTIIVADACSNRIYLNLNTLYSSYDFVVVCLCDYVVCGVGGIGCCVGLMVEMCCCC